MAEDEMISRIKDWVQKSGKALELRVAQAMTVRLGPSATVEPGVMYQDASTDKYREADVLASVPYPGDNSRRVQVVVECKSSNSGPWVVFTDRQAYVDDDEAFRHALLAYRGQVDAKAAWRAVRGTQCVPSVVPGYAIVDALCSKTFAYDAVRQTTNAALHFSGQVSMEMAQAAGYFQLVIPVVVTEAPLYECSLDDAGKVRVVPTNHSSVYVQPDAPRPPTPVQVMTEDHLVGEWIGDLTTTVQLMR
jgi:hypothetical protein